MLINFFKNKFIKKSVLNFFGGGVLGDVCGLASCLYLRGLVHLHIPTTMTSIVDSCIGGKRELTTSINYGKTYIIQKFMCLRMYVYCLKESI